MGIDIIAFTQILSRADLRRTPSSSLLSTSDRRTATVAASGHDRLPACPVGGLQHLLEHAPSEVLPKSSSLVQRVASESIRFAHWRCQSTVYLSSRWHSSRSDAYLFSIDHRLLLASPSLHQTIAATIILDEFPREVAQDLLLLPIESPLLSASVDQQQYQRMLVALVHGHQPLRHRSLSHLPANSIRTELSTALD